MDDSVADEVVDAHWHHLVNALRTGVYDNDLDVIKAAELRHTARDPVLDTISERMTLLQQNDEENGVEDS